MASTSATFDRQRLILAISLVVLIGLSWAYLASMAGLHGAAVDHPALSHQDHPVPDTGGPATADGAIARTMEGAPSARFGWALAMWATMAVAMMLPTTVPLVLLFGRYRRAKFPGRDSLAASFGLIAGYLCVWLVFAVGAAWLQWLLEPAGLLTPDRGALRSPLVAGAVIVVAGIYQLTPLKTACLNKCRSPMMFLNTRWRDGRTGPFVMGLDDGLYCLGCCWALMLVMFVTGVMSLLWMAALTILMVTEKLIPRGLVFARATGVALVAGGLWTALG